MATNGFNQLGEKEQNYVSVYYSEVDDKGKKKTSFKFVICHEGRKFASCRRYSEFYRLYSKLKKSFPDLGLKLPGRKLLGTRDPTFIKQRQDALVTFMQTIMSEPKLHNHPEFCQFLTQDKKQRKSSSDDDDEDQIDDKSFASDTDSNVWPSDRTVTGPADFELLRVIGNGSYGKVLLARHKVEGRLYAVKVLSKAYIIGKREEKHIMSERNILVRSIRHPFLVAMHYSFQTQHKLFFVLDYVNGGELFHHLQKEKRFSEPRCRFYAAEITSALGYLHSQSIIYRDLKPENILLDAKGHVVLTDFGLCKEGIIGRQTTTTFCGTPEYLAPEVLRKQPYDKTVDWWCLGCVLYEMLFGVPPFYSREVSVMYDGILHRPLEFRSSAVGSPEARSIIEGLLHKEQMRRLGARNDAVAVKAHPFFAPINWSLLEKKKIDPPYIPCLTNDLDLQNFDPEFTQEPVPASLETNGNNVKLNPESDGPFKGFSYVPANFDFKDITNDEVFVDVEVKS